ncbi:MAG TPA: pyridoxal-phosphate dependent enzyme [Myxococcota bacterium]
MQAQDPALFRAYPELRSRFPHHPILPGPTPVGTLRLAGLPAGVLFVKRDERSSPLYGGNKPRKLEWILGAALARGSRHLVTTGGLGTHHGLATTILAREAGLRTTLVLLMQPVTAEVQRSLLLHAAWGARQLWGRNLPGTAAQVLRALAVATARGERPLLVPPGGSSASGQLGFVSAGLELAEQVRAGLLPEPAELYVAVGTGGTHAGLVAGLALAGLRTRVVGVLVTDILPPSPRKLARMARSVLRRLRRGLPNLPQPVISERDFDFVRSQLGPGYGAVTPAAREAVAAAAGLGLELETTYTGKCLAALIERTKGRAAPRGPILFWNTFNAVDVEKGAPAPLDPRAVPRSLRRFLAQRPVD